MELPLALVVIAAGLYLARHAYLHPGDYLVAAAIALLLAGALLPALPGNDEMRVLLALGAPQAAIARSEFLADHGVLIIVALLLTAAGFCMSAELRRRATPEQFA